MRNNDVEQLLDMARLGERLSDLEVDAVVKHILSLNDLDSVRRAFLACSARYENVYRIHPRVENHIHAVVENSTKALHD